jgi:hypothetical protein
LREQSQNVYENKGSARKTTTPNLTPPYPRRGIHSPPRTRRGGGAANLQPWRQTNVQVTELREQSQNVYENKGSVRKSTTPDPSLSKEGNIGWTKQRRTAQARRIEEQKVFSSRLAASAVRIFIYFTPRRISPGRTMFVLRFAIAEGNFLPVKGQYSYEHYGNRSRLCGLNHGLGPG